MATAMPLPTKTYLSSTKSVINSTLSVQFGDGKGQYAPDGANPRTELWDITWGPLSRADRITVETALDTVGGWGTLTYTPCNETVQKKFRVVDGKYSTNQIGNEIYEVKCSIIQRYD